MRKFHYKLSLMAGFCICFIASFMPSKNRPGSAHAAIERTSTKPGMVKTSIPADFEQNRQTESGCRRLVFEEDSFIICKANPAHDMIKLFWADSRGQPYRYFRNIRAMLERNGQNALFLMNAGMYHKDFSPVGLYIENSRKLHPAARHNGRGNFFMKPNGIFYIANGKAGVMETEAFLRAGIKPQLATQSGPMLTIHNHLHPKFIPNSPYKEYRNGVGVNARGEVFFAISEGKVNFDTFARMFRDSLHTPDALFLDGSISSLYAPQAHRADWFYPMGPIIGVVTPIH